MDKLFSLIVTLNLADLLRGAALDVTTLTPDQFKACANLLAQCILNGPVGVNTVTDFPTGEKGSIKTVLNLPKLSNTAWRNVAGPIAQKLQTSDDLVDVIKSSQQFVIHGKLWPLWDVKKQKL